MRYEGGACVEGGGVGVCREGGGMRYEGVACGEGGGVGACGGG